jgi:quercetin dioxygenase-like cupin family protein
MRVVIGPDQSAPNFIMRVFEIAPGGYSYKHQHDYEHEIFFHAGHGEVVYEDRTVPVGPGAIAFIKPNALHQIRNTGGETLTFICVIPNPE